MTKKRVVLVVGTRPEAIKMAPVQRALEAHGVVHPVLVSSGQHRELLHDALAAQELTLAHDLNVMLPGQSLTRVLSQVTQRLDALLRDLHPAAVLVQGDTTTALAAALAAHHLGIDVGHVEAGLRTYDLAHPFPEEANRQACDRLCRWFFAPTESAALNLASERVERSRVFVTGNTAVDSLLWALSRTEFSLEANTVLVTLHRRESFGEPLREILAGLREFLDTEENAQVVWPIHPNPEVLAAAEEMLCGDSRVRRIEPIPHDRFAGALATCRLVLTDSGGIQEEGPSLGKTVLVCRERTERPEALVDGRNRLVGRTRAGVRDALLEAWKEPQYSGALPAPNPYGDGMAGERIASIVERSLSA